VAEITLPSTNPAGMGILRRIEMGGRLRRDAYGWTFGAGGPVDGRSVQGLVRSGLLAIIEPAGYRRAFLTTKGIIKVRSVPHPSEPDEVAP
jgi:hypothetical protein